jgi:predicted tellurium resistance membrane protein TerC
MDAFLTADGLIAFVTLTVLEVVLGIDNVIFISILAGKLPVAEQDRARKIGLMAAMVMRILLLMSIAWIIRLTAPLFSIGSHQIHEKLEGEDGHVTARVAPSMAAVIGQIMLLDIVFSLDSVITAVGMAEDLAVMIAAVVVAVGIMFFSAGSVSRFVDAHPTVKVLALSFLLLIGCSLIAEGFGAHIPKGYIYFAMGFSVFVEAINLRVSKKGKAVKLHDAYHSVED